MDGESVSSFPSENEGDEPPFSFAKVFRDQFAYYIHLGMTYEEYWRLDCELVRSYRKAYEYKQEYDNSQLWLQGLYIYKAMEAQRPGWVFYTGKTPKPKDYMEKPIAVTKELQDQYAAEKTALMAEQFKERFKRHNQTLDESPKENEGNGEYAGREFNNIDSG